MCLDGVLSRDRAVKKISLGSWAFSFGPYADNPVGLDRIARRLAQAGYDGIELCGFPPHVTFDAYAEPSERRKLRKFLADLGLSVSGYAADFMMATPTLAANREIYLDRFRRAVEIATDLGSPTIRVDTVAAPGSIPDSEYLSTQRHLAEVWNEAAQIAAQSGVGMVWEFEPGFAYNKPSEVGAIYEQVGHPNFSILFDTCHAYMCAVAAARQSGETETLAGGVGEFLDQCAGRIGAIHLIDSDGTLWADETSTHVPFGEGKIDFAALAPALRAISNVEWWTIDMAFLPDAWRQIDPALRYVRGLAAEL